MATNVITLNVYEINGLPLNSPKSIDFPSTGFTTLPYQGANYTVLYSVLKTSVSPYDYAVVETAAQLKALANA
jgi:hypothetical protein